MNIDFSNQNWPQDTVEQKVAELLADNQQVISINFQQNQLFDLVFLKRYKSQLSALKILNISFNKLEDMTLGWCPVLLTLDASHNPVKSISLVGMRELKSADFRECGLRDEQFMTLLDSGVQFKHLRLSGNQITDLGVQTICQKRELAEGIAAMATLDLKQNITQYQSLLQVKQLLPLKFQSSKLPALKAPSAPSSRASSSRAKKIIAPGDTVLQFYQALERKGEGANAPSVMVETLLGPGHPMASQFADRCGKEMLCSALIAGIRCQPDLEESIAQGFVRKAGTIFCRQFKAGANISCKERCAAVLTITQKKTDLLNKETTKPH